MDRWIVTRVKKDRSVPVRYQRVGWIAFDTQHKAHGSGVWPSKAEAQAECDTRNGQRA